MFTNGEISETDKERPNGLSKRRFYRLRKKNGKMNQQGESVYEAGYLDIYETTIRSSPAVVKSSDPKSSVIKRNEPKSRLKKILCLMCLLATLAFAVCVIALLAVLLGRQTSISSMLQANEISRPASCLELRQSGVRSSGIHQIQLPDEHVPIEVFCDMETDDGGWSLVASIHESDITAKCSFDDRWSNYAPNAETYRGKTNWENSMTFGEVRKCLYDDYKNAVFHKISAEDVMLWHVPSFLPISQAKNVSTLRYRTANKFLGRYGANLRNLFRDHFPLKPVSGLRGGTNSMKSLISSLTRIKREIKGWYDYPVPYGEAAISDKKFFPGETNEVQFESEIGIDYAEYGIDHRDDHLQFHWFNEVTTPYVYLNVIGNDLQRSKYFRIKVYSYHKIRNPIVTKFENTSASGNFKLHYHAIQFANLSMRTECRFYFYVSNDKDWRSTPPTVFHKTDERSSLPGTSTYSIEGVPQRVLFGYMLLFKNKGQNYTSIELDKVAAFIVKSVAKFPRLMEGWRYADPLVVPVIFDKGSEESVLQSAPKNMTKYIDAGNLQFSSYNNHGFPNAICPGVSVSSMSPEYVCVGGISNDITENGTCGDFAGWGGRSQGTEVNRGTYSYYLRLFWNREWREASPVSNGFGHSSSDMSATILIFYR